jgi:hypothetical protein
VTNYASGTSRTFQAPLNFRRGFRVGSQLPKFKRSIGRLAALCDVVTCFQFRRSLPFQPFAITFVFLVRKCESPGRGRGLSDVLGCFCPYCDAFPSVSGTQVVCSLSYLNPGADFSASLVVLSDPPITFDAACKKCAPFDPGRS